MSILDNIRSRRSVRAFDGTDLRPEDAEKIMACAAEAGNPYELAITWRLLDAGKDGLTSPVITGTNTWIAGKMQRVPHAEEAFGYSFEKIVLYAESLGIGTTIIAGTMNRPAFEKAVNLDDGEVLPCVSPLGYPAKKMSLREIMMRKGVRADSRFNFGELFFDGKYGTALSPEKAGNLQSAFEAVRLAPSAVNKQPWRIVLCGNEAHFYEKHSKGYISADNWDMQKIDMGIALCHFELAAKENGINVFFKVEDPGLETEADAEYVASYGIRG